MDRPIAEKQGSFTEKKTVGPGKTAPVSKTTASFEKTQTAPKNEDPPGLKEAMAEKRRNLSEQALIKKGSVHLIPETWKPYSGRVYRFCEDYWLESEVLLIDGKKEGLEIHYFGTSDGAKFQKPTTKKA